MKDELFKRRQRMLRLLAVGTSPKVVVEILNKEFDVPKKTIYADYYKINDWAHIMQQDDQLSSILREHLDLLSRELLGVMLESGPFGDKKSCVKERVLKVNAANAALKVVQEQIKLGQNLGLIERKPEEALIYGAVGMPFACDPEIKKALIAETKRQAQQRELEDKGRIDDAAESDQT